MYQKLRERIELDLAECYKEKLDQENRSGLNLDYLHGWISCYQNVLDMIDDEEENQENT